MVTTPKGQRVRKGEVPKAKSVQRNREGHLYGPKLRKTLTAPQWGHGREDPREYTPSPHPSRSLIVCQWFPLVKHDQRMMVREHNNTDRKGQPPEI